MDIAGGLNDKCFDSTTVTLPRDISNNFVDVLPESTLLQIFSNLDVIDLCLGIRLVNKRWKALSYDFILWKKVDFDNNETISDFQMKSALVHIGYHIETLNLRGCVSLTENLFVCLPTLCPNLKELDVAHTFINDKCVMNIVNSFQELEEFNCSNSFNPLSCANEAFMRLTKLKRYSQPTLGPSDGCLKDNCKYSSDIATVVANCKALNYINLSDCCLSDEGLIKALSRANQVTHLCIQRCTALTDENLGKALENMSNLTSLDISHTHIGDKGIATIVSAHPRLQRIAMSGCDRITDVAVSELARKCHNLLHVIINDEDECSANVTDTAMVDMAQYSKRLRTLKIARSAVTDVGLCALLAGCPDIEDLNVSGCISLTDTSIKILEEACPKLRHLDVSQCVHLTPKGIGRVFQGCKHLITLNLETCHNISKLALENRSDADVFRPPSLRLTHLDVSFCSKVADIFVKQISSVCSHLRHVNIAGCYLVSDNAVEHLTKGCKMLEYLCISSKSAFQSSKFTDASLLSIAKYGKSLQTLEMTKLKLVSKDGITTLVRKCENLRKLDITVGTPKIARDELIELLISSHTRCKVVRERVLVGKKAKESNVYLKFPSLSVLKRLRKI